jgi:hypothetical protein
LDLKELSQTNIEPSNVVFGRTLDITAWISDSIRHDIRNLIPYRAPEKSILQSVPSICKVEVLDDAELYLDGTFKTAGGKLSVHDHSQHSSKAIGICYKREIYRDF